jgi:ribonuclease HI
LENWLISLAKNIVFFQGKLTNPRAIFHRMIVSLPSQAPKLAVKLPRTLVQLPQIPQRGQGFFNDTTPLNQGHCVVGRFIIMLDDSLISFKLGLKQGTNNKVELLETTYLLITTLEKGVSNNDLYGDSRVVIGWLQRTTKVHNIHLNPRVALDQDIALRFANHSFNHVYEALNTTMYGPEKQVMDMDVG